MADLKYEPGVVYSVSGVAEMEAGAAGASDTEFAAARVAAGEDGVMQFCDWFCFACKCYHLKDHPTRHAAGFTLEAAYAEIKRMAPAIRNAKNWEDTQRLMRTTTYPIVRSLQLAESI